MDLFRTAKILIDTEDSSWQFKYPADTTQIPVSVHLVTKQPDDTAGTPPSGDGSVSHMSWKDIELRADEGTSLSPEQRE